uniref:PX domain-containing protein n=1 Tax=Timema genevievae TaxID=629358 RepID=A0A7R9K2T1_TIMGE|nr:unnamed protein product [Timema genevievae]
MMKHWCHALSAMLCGEGEEKKGDTIITTVSVENTETWEHDKKFTVYKVMVTSDSQSWFVFRRYNEFYKLYESLKKQVPQLQLKLPGKKLFGNNLDPSFVQSRREGLDAFIQQLMTDHRLIHLGVVVNRTWTHIGGQRDGQPNGRQDLDHLLDKLSYRRIKGWIAKWLTREDLLVDKHRDESSRVAQVTDKLKQYKVINVVIERPEVREFFQLDRRKVSSEDGSLEDEGGSDINPVNLGPSERIAKPSDFEFLRVIGKGSFGKVLLARHKVEKLHYAVKKNPLDLRHIDPEFTREPVSASVGCSQSHSTCVLSASVREADDAFAGFSYAPPIEL